MTYDVAIIGAGPAGTSAAFHLARRGCRVVFVDKSVFPRPKVCGDGLTPRALRAVSRMGVDLREHSPVWVTAGCLVDRRSSTRKLFRLEPSGAVGAVMPRAAFDHLLVRAAVQAGAEFRPGTRALALLREGPRVRGILVTGQQGQEEIAARSTIVAEGGTGRFAREIRGSTASDLYTGFAARQYFRNVEGLDPHFEIHVPVYVEGHVVAGYGWVFPSGSGSANVGAGFFGRSQSGERIDLRRLYTSFVEELLATDPRFSSAQAMTRIEGAPLRIGMDPGQPSAASVLLIGDAAGLVNPFTGEGIAQAIESGEAAAEAVGGALHDPLAASATYRWRLAHLYPRHHRLRETLPDLLATEARLLDRHWHEIRRTRGRAVAQAAHRLALDRPPPQRGAWLHGVLRDLEERDPILGRQLRGVRNLVRRHAAAARPLFGEIARYAHYGLPFPSGLLATVLLLCGRTSSSLTDGESPAVMAAAALELFSLSQLFQLDIPGRERRRRPVRRERGAANVVLADVMTAALIELVAALPAERARLTRALRDYAAAAAAGDRRRSPGRCLTERRAALIGDAAEIGARLAGRPPADVTALRQYGTWLGRAISVTGDISADIFGIPGFGIRTGFWLRRDTCSAPVRHALRGPAGHSIQRLLAGRGPGRADTLRILRVAAATGAFRWAVRLIEQAAARAENALDRNVRSSELLRLVTGVTATAHALARKTGGDQSGEARWALPEHEAGGRQLWQG